MALSGLTTANSEGFSEGSDKGEIKMVHRIEEEEGGKGESYEVNFDALAMTRIGPKILNAAIEKRKNELSEAVVSQAQELLRVKAVAEEEIRRNQQIIKDANEKISKLNNGQFTIGYGGSISYK